MKKILSLLALSPLALSACSGGAGVDEAFEYNLGEPTCENQTVSFNDFQIMFNAEPEKRATIIIEMEGMDDYTAVILPPQIGEEISEWYDRDLSFTASPTTCEVYKTTFAWA